jgi:hypothetical protein
LEASTPPPPPTPPPTATPAPTPVRVNLVDEGFYSIDPGARQEFRGVIGDYAFTSLYSAADRATVRWSVTAPPKASCRVVMRMEPSSGKTITRTIRVSAGDKATGNARYATSFSDAALLVDSTCRNWIVSMQGQETPPAGGGGGNCDSSYPGVCIPPYPPDLDCGDIAFRRFEVRGPDPHGFDGDNDGVGCESG